MEIIVNPNNCATCQHKKHPQGGWCYMFKSEPREMCFQHTAYQRFTEEEVRRLKDQLLPQLHTPEDK
jgi:hypothetical protein